MKTGYALILGFVLVPAAAVAFTACGNGNAGQTSIPPEKQACFDLCHMYGTVCGGDCSSNCDLIYEQSGTECLDEWKIMLDCYLSHFPQTHNCNIFNDATCKFERSDYALCLWTYECDYDPCYDITPADAGADAATVCGCAKTCETVVYVQRCTWNGTAFDCNCEKEGASVGTCQINAEPACTALDPYSYCCDPYFGL